MNWSCGVSAMPRRLAELQAALGEREVEELVVVEEEQVEGDEADRQTRGREEIDLLAAEALLEFGERERAAVAPADDFAIEDEVAGDVAKRIDEFGEFGDAIQRARIDLDLAAALVCLGADAVEFFFDQGAVGKCGDQVGRGFGRAGEHCGNWTEELHADGG